RLLHRFQPSQNGNLLEQFFSISQQGTSREYVTLFEKMAAQLPGLSYAFKPRLGYDPDTECIILSSDFELPDDNHVLLRDPRENNMYNVDLKNIISSGYLTCLFAKATLDESNLWHRRLGHINFKTMNKLVKGKFDGKADEEFLVGYSVSSKAFRVFNSRTKIIQETLDIKFLENQPNFARSGPTCLFDIDTLTKSMNYQPVIAGNQPNSSADPQNTDVDTTFEVKEPESEVHVSPSSSTKTKKHDDKTKREAKGKSLVELSTGVRNLTCGKSSYVDPSHYPDDPDMPALKDITYSDDEEDVGAEADFSNLEANINVSPIPTTRVHKDHPVTQVISDLSSAPQTRIMTRMVKEQDPSWIEAMQEELFQFKMQKVWVLVDLPKGKRAIGSKWVFRNKKDERGIVIRNKARLVAQGYTQEKGIDYEEVFAPVARIEAIRLFLAYASFMGFMVYKMDVKSSFLYRTIEEEVYVCQPLGFEDPDYPDKVYKVIKELYGLHQAPRAWYETLANYLLENGFQRRKIGQTLFIKKQKGDILLVQVYVDDIIFRSTNKDLCKAFEKLIKDKFQMSSMGEITFFLGLQVKQKQDRIFISQDKYVAKILRKFRLTDGKSASTPIDTEKPLLKDPDVKRIFRYLKGKPYLGLWYPKDPPFNLMAYSDSDYVGASLDRKSTTGGCQFLAATRCYAQVLWIQNQLLDYGLIINVVSFKLLLFGLTIDAVHLMLLGHKTNDVVRLQALIDRRKVIITEDTVRQALQLDNAKSIDCLPNEEIFAELARMGYEKPSTKLTFYKAFFLA
nr:hypothetical protein [Tanacetum cinerariifolium]